MDEENPKQNPADSSLNPAIPPEEIMPRVFMNKKPVIYRDAKTVLNVHSAEFQEKLLCDGIIFNLGDACVYSCSFCYVSSFMRFHTTPLIKALNDNTDCSLGFEDVVVRRTNAVDLLRGQLLKDGKRIYPDDSDNRVAYSSTTVDVAANIELLQETADACNLILDNTAWQIRLLSKSNLLHRLMEKNMIPDRHRDRIIFGFSTGTLDDKVAKAFEAGTALVSQRLKSLRWLQQEGYRTFGMICPSLPQDDYESFSREICDAINVNECEEVWAEIINVRGNSLNKTLEALRNAGLNSEAERLAEVSGPGSQAAREDYSRETFLAHTRHVPFGKLRYLQYIDETSADWWAKQRGNGAVLLGKTAQIQNLTVLAPTPAEDLQLIKNPSIVTKNKLTVTKVSRPLTKHERKFLKEREQIVTEGVRASIAAAIALSEIHGYEGGRLWSFEFPNFEAYCAARWDYRKTHSYRLVDCGDFVAKLAKEPEASHSPIGDWLPNNEAQYRAFASARVPEEQEVDLWRQIRSETASIKLTGTIVGEIANKFMASRVSAGEELPVQKEPKPVDASKLLEKLTKATLHHANSVEISQLLRQLGELLRCN